MRSIKSGLVGFAMASLFGAVAVVGCTADGASDDDFIDFVEDTEPTEPTPTLPSGLESQDDDEPSPSPDAGANNGGGNTKPDAGKTEKDAGPPPPEPGDACTTADQIVSRSCGMCGKQEAICQEVNGKLEWSDYGPCEKEMGVCMPGDTESCGNCGTKTCSNMCTWSICTGQPTNSCAPGGVRYSKAGCASGGYKNQTCSATCEWGNFSTECVVPTTPNKMTILGTVGNVKSQQWTLQTETISKPNTTCNGTVTSSAVRYIPVEVSNTTGKAAEISAYHTKSPTGIEMDTVMWYYNGNSLPMSDDEVGACVGKLEDGCSTAGNACTGTSSLNLAGIGKITIPAGGKILVYSGLWSATGNAGDGTFVLNLRTDKLL